MSPRFTYRRDVLFKWFPTSPIVKKLAAKEPNGYPVRARLPCPGQRLPAERTSRAWLHCADCGVCDETRADAPPDLRDVTCNELAALVGDGLNKG